MNSWFEPYTGWAKVSLVMTTRCTEFTLLSSFFIVLFICITTVNLLVPTPAYMLYIGLAKKFICFFL